MHRLTVRLKLHLLVITAIAALALVGFGGWLSIDRLGSALHGISERSLPAVSSLGPLRAARLQIIKAMQDGVAWRPQQYDTPDDTRDFLEEGKSIFTDLIAMASEENEVAGKAFATYDALPKTAAEAEQWERFKAVWKDFEVIDRR